MKEPFETLRGLARKTAAWTAAALTRLLLVPFFYLCFLPGRLVLLLLEMDPLSRKFPSSRPSYWTPRTVRTGPGRYRRMY